MSNAPKTADELVAAAALLHSRRQIDWLVRLARIRIAAAEPCLPSTGKALEQSRRLLDAVLDPHAPVPFRCASEPAQLSQLDSSIRAAASADRHRAPCRSCGRSSAHRPMDALEAVAHRVHLRAALGALDGDWLAFLRAQFPTLQRCCTCDHLELLSVCNAYEEQGPRAAWLTLGVTDQLTKEAEAALAGHR